MKEVEELPGPDKIQKQKEEVRRIIRKHATSNTYLDLTNRSILAIPDELFMLPNIEYLYLESNYLEELPDNFFDNLPMLKWLDLRDNKLVYIPPSIGTHRNLKNILLEKNQLTHLPLELGNLHTVTGLSLRGNPLVIPPPLIVEQGVQVILSYLLDELNAGDDATGSDEENEWQYGNNEDYSEEEDDELNMQSMEGGVQQLDNGMGQHGPTPIPAMFHHPRSRNKDNNSLWRDKTKMASLSATVKMNELNFTNSTIHGRKSEQDSRKNWVAKMQQKRQDTMVLDEWRQEAKRLKNLLLPNSRSEKTHLPPYAIDTNTAARPITEEERKIRVDVMEEKVDRVDPRNAKTKSVLEDGKNIASLNNLFKIVHALPGIYDPRDEKEEKTDRVKIDDSENARRLENVKEKLCENSVAADRDRIDNEVQQRIRQHTSQLRKQRNAKDSLLQPGRELQRELLDQKMARDSEIEYRFRAFTGDSSSLSSSKKTSSL